MLRSFLARSQPLLSRLRWPAAAPMHATPRIGPSRAYASSAAADERTATAAKHLYVVLEERYRYSIYKLPAIDEDTVIDDQAPRSLPRAAISLSERLVGPNPHFEALGSKIAIYGYDSCTAKRPRMRFLLTMLYDTKTETLDGGGPLPVLPEFNEEVEIKEGHNAAAAPVDGGNKLCVLEAQENKPMYLYDQKVSYYKPFCRYKNFPEWTPEWIWEQGPSPLPRGATSYDDSSFKSYSYDGSVKSHAVHPDGHTIFASSSFTFSLDTQDGKSARHGDWLLPFNGRAYYDGDLDAWVGIRFADGTEGGSTKGYPYLCACDVPTTTGDDTMLPEPAWTMCKDELTFAKAPSHARSPSLVHIGCGMFCVVEITPPSSDGVQHLLHVTMFHATHGNNGELLFTPCRPGRSYLVPNYYSKRFYTAMWM